MNEFAAPRVTQTGANSYNVSHGDDSGILAQFENYAIHNEARSNEQGHICYDDIIHITMHFPGDKTKVVCRKVKMISDAQGPSDPERFPRQWAAFKAQQEQIPDGTPLTEWPPLTKSQVLELKATHIHTVESLANLPDSSLTWMGSRDLRDKAKAWLGNAKGGSEVTRLLGENDALRNDVDVLKRQVQELAAIRGVDVPQIPAAKARAPAKPKAARSAKSAKPISKKEKGDA